MFTDEEDVQNYIGVNIKKNLYGAFELSQSHMVNKLFNHVGLAVSAILKSIDKPTGKPLLNKYGSSIGKK